MMSVQIGANIGEALNIAQHEAGKQVEVTQSTENKSLYLVGIEMLPKESGRMTMDAQTRHVGRVIIGPSSDQADIDFDTFIQRTKTYKLQCNSFNINMTSGHITRGSVVANRSLVYACPACNEQFKLSFSELNRSKRQRQRPPNCDKCEIKPPLVWRYVDMPSIVQESKLAERMFNAFTTVDTKATSLDKYIIPRIWAIYSEHEAPSEWAPEVGDYKAAEIMRREREQGLTIRPFQHAMHSKSIAVKGLLLEATINRATGTPGVAIGWLDSNIIAGTGDEAGYTVRLKPKETTRKRKQKSRKSFLV